MISRGIDGDGNPYAIFTPLTPYETKEAMNSLCEAYNNAIDEGKDDPTPFIKHLLYIVDMAYRDFEGRLDIIKAKVSSSDMVRMAFEKKVGKVTKSDIAELCPGISISAVEKGIVQLVKSGEVLKMGNGKKTFYIKK